MSIQNKLIGPCAKFIPKHDDVEIEIDALIRRLFLFETYILHSIRLKEFKHLIPILGYEGLINLMNSGLLKVHCHAYTLGQYRQPHEIKISHLQNKKENLIIGPYSFNFYSEHNSKKYISGCFRDDIDTIDNVSLKKRIKLKHTILDSMVFLPKESGIDTLKDFQRDLETNLNRVKEGVRNKLSEIIPEKVLAKRDFILKIRRSSELDFEIETNLASSFSLDNNTAHEIVQGGILSCAGLNFRINEMLNYSALSIFKDNELPYLDEKIKYSIVQAGITDLDDQFQRVIEIKGFPHFKQSHGKVNISKLLEIRESNEFKEFRQSLIDLKSATDLDVYEKFESISAKFSSFVHSTPGKAIRLLFLTGVGLIDNLAGLGLGAVDMFFLEKILPKPGPITFINNKYPSIFKHSDSK